MIDLKQVTEQEYDNYINNHPEFTKSQRGSNSEFTVCQHFDSDGSVRAKILYNMWFKDTTFYVEDNVDG